MPAGDQVLVASPALGDPFMDASEIEVRGRDHGQITLAGGFASHGETISRVRNKKGAIVEILIAGNKLLPEGKVAKELQARYERR